MDVSNSRCKSPRADCKISEIVIQPGTNIFLVEGEESRRTNPVDFFVKKRPALK